MQYSNSKSERQMEYPQPQPQSPFLKDLPQRKCRSRNIRKKIYKFMMAKRYQREQNENCKSISQIMIGKVLPASLRDVGKNDERFSLDLIERIEFKNGVDIAEMRALVSLQEKSVEELSHKEASYVCSTAKKRRVLGELHQYQSADKRNLFLTTANREQDEFSFQALIPEISLFNLPELEEKKHTEDPFQLKESISFCHMELRSSNRSSSLFDEPPQNDPLEFI